jgi:hypothetical protein
MGKTFLSSRRWMAFLPLSALLFTAGHASAAPEAKPEASPESVVVAIRYYQIEGTSHARLYLFQRDGKQVRQLTKDSNGQDHDPVFSPDGGEIVYQRTTGEKEQFRAISPSGDKDRALESAPEWYASQAAPPPAFGAPESIEVNGEKRLSLTAKAGDIPFPLPGGGLELTLKDDPERKQAGDPDWFPKRTWLRETAGGKEVCLETFPVFSPKRAGKEKEFWASPLPGGSVAHEERKDEDIRWESTVAETILLRDKSPFLDSPPLLAAFFLQHRGSTDGSGVFAADLHEKRLYELTPNGGVLYALPGLPAFACVCTQRYLPLGDGKRTVNCSYLDLWDAKMRRVRFAEARPALFYGAALFVKAAKPLAFRFPRD